MAISFPTPEVARQSFEREAGEHAFASSAIVAAGRLLRRGYERLCSAIFDPEGDCMRF
jgi:hypothetical protein